MFRILDIFRNVALRCIIFFVALQQYLAVQFFGSDFRDPEKWPSYVDPATLMPKDLHDQERVYDAFHKDHPVK